MSFAELLDQDRRLVLLRGLQSAAQYRANAYLLRRFCAAMGHTVSADQTETDLAWLAEQRLVTTEKVGETVGGISSKVTLATLTVRGLDVATGVSVVPGVTQPAPGT